jgi:hypothetical protein
MRKALSTLAIMVMGCLALYAQSPTQPQSQGPTPPPSQAQPRAYESQISYQKGQQAATVIDLPYPPDVVEASIRGYMARKGWKGSGSRGFIVFRNVRLDEGSTVVNDLHVKVDRKSRKDKNSSVVTWLTAGPNEDPAARTGRDTMAMSRTAVFVEAMTPSIESGDLEDRIKTQEKVTKKGQDKLADQRDDQVSYEKKIRDAQSDLEDNKKDQAKEAQQMQDGVNANNPDATKKSHKRMDKLLSNQTSLQKKIEKNQAALEQNKKDQEMQQTGVQQQQQMLDSLKAMRKN